MSDFQTNNAQGPAPQAKSVSFGEAVKLFFSNYVNFSGRSTKSEFWWGYLFCVIVDVVIGVLSRALPGANDNNFIIGFTCNIYPYVSAWNKKTA